MKTFPTALFIVLGLTSSRLAHAERLYGLTEGDLGRNTLISFDSLSPESYQTIGPVSGVVAGQSLRSMDFRPSTGKLYALSTFGADAQLYTVDLTTGALTTVGGTFSVRDFGATTAAMEFDPVSDHIRIITDSGSDLGINPDTLSLTALGSGFSSNSTVLIGLAYGNPAAGAAAAYGYDVRTNSIGVVGPSPMSTFASLGPSGVDPSQATIGFDVSAATGTAYLSIDNLASMGIDMELFSVDLSTGRTTPIGRADSLPRLLDIAVAPVPEPATLTCLGFVAAAMLRRRKRA